jgi:hypothetical protein
VDRLYPISPGSRMMKARMVNVILLFISYFSYNINVYSSSYNPLATSADMLSGH